MSRFFTGNEIRLLWTLDLRDGRSSGPDFVEPYIQLRAIQLAEQERLGFLPQRPELCKSGADLLVVRRLEPSWVGHGTKWKDGNAFPHVHRVRMEPR